LSLSLVALLSLDTQLGIRGFPDRYNLYQGLIASPLLLQDYLNPEDSTDVFKIVLSKM